MRVIAGSARGRPLRPPRSGDTRPTSDLIKGVIFSALEAEAYKRGFEPNDEGAMATGLAWPRVLDLFAGSGALGIEALSRGARHADFVDNNADALAAIGANLRATGLEEYGTAHRGDAAESVARLRGAVDLVFVDPPYAADETLARVVRALARSDLLTPSSMVVLEAMAGGAPPPAIGPLEQHSTRSHGRTRVTVYGTRRAARAGTDQTPGC